MIEWREDGILLTARPHGESAAIIDVLTEGHGRHAGVVRGGASRKLQPTLQPGAQLDLTWSARLAEHLGAFRVEPVKFRAAALMADRARLAGLNATVALLVFALPEREAHADLYRRTVALLDMMVESEFWAIAYLRWELALLEDLGFGLDLSRCAVTGARTGLAFVSPRTGRAVTAAAAGEHAPRLLPLSPALIGRGSGSAEEIAAGLAVTGHFLETGLAASVGTPVPQARVRLVRALAP